MKPFERCWGRLRPARPSPRTRVTREYQNFTIALRVSVTPTRIRVPDLVVLRPGVIQDILTAPPLLVIEILSPDDTYSDLQERCQDYRAMGVETIWIIDPKTRSGRMASGPDWIAAERLEVPGTPIFVDLPNLFAQINTQAAPSGN